MSDTATPRRAALHTLGCRLNQTETGLLEERLRAEGYEIVPFEYGADLGIINTCTVTHHADAKSRKAIRAFVRRNPGAYLAVIGCYSQMGYQALSEIDGVDLIVGNQEKLNVLNYVRAGKNERPLVVRDQFLRDDFAIESAGDAPFCTRANLKIQDGCDFMCSFCVIPFARGRARSREFSDLMQEARGLVARGAKELVLTGVNIGTYAHGGRTMIDVIDALNEIDGLSRIRISSIEPTTIPVELFERMNDLDHVLTPYLHVPMQSGSDRVLGLMRRKYTRSELLDFVNLAVARVPDICIGTDVLVGMPGETEEDFAETCSLLANGPFAYAHVFKYSEREGTAAVRMDGKASEDEKNRRSAVIRALSGRKLAEFHGKYAGKTVEVLFESQENGLWSGYTGNYVRVATGYDDILENGLREVVLGRSCGDFVMGRLVGETPAGEDAHPTRTFEVCA